MQYTDHFLRTQPDYLEEIFDFFPEGSISFSIERHQNKYSGLEDINFISDLSNTNQGSFSFNLEDLSQYERNKILDLFLNEQKANALSNSFLFKHPIYNEYFVCKFNKNIQDSIYRHGRYSQDTIEFDIIGVDSNLISQSVFIVGELPTTEFIPFSS